MPVSPHRPRPTATQTTACLLGSRWLSGWFHHPGAATPGTSPTPAWAASPGIYPGKLVHLHLGALGEPQRGRPPPRRTRLHSEGAVPAARLIQVAQRLLQTMRRRFGEPGVFFFSFHQFVGLLVVVHPPTTAPVLTALLQTGVPHRPAHLSALLRQPRLRIGQLNPKPSTGLHVPQTNTSHRQVAAAPRHPGAAGRHRHEPDALTPTLKSGVRALRPPDQGRQS